MTLERHIIMLTDKNKTYFINDRTGVKLVLETEKNTGRLIPEKISESDIKRAFEEDRLDIDHLKGRNPTSMEIQLFKIFITEYIKQNKMFDGKIKENSYLWTKATLVLKVAKSFFVTEKVLFLNL